MVDFFANGLCIHCHLAKNELIDFAQFNHEVEESWKEKDSRLQEEVGQLLEKYPEKHHEDIVDTYSWELHLNQSKYPGLHRESLVITIFNFLEHQLNNLCSIFYESVDSKLKLNDLNGSGVERALLYLTKVVKIDFSKFGYELPTIKGVNLVRNWIVHNGGGLPDDPRSKVNKFVQSSEYLLGVEGGSVKIRPEFIDSFLKVLESFFEKLDLEVQRYIQSYNG